MDCDAIGRKHIQWIGAAVALLSVASLVVDGLSIVRTDGARLSIHIPGGLLGIVLGWRLWVGGPRAANWTQRITAFLTGFCGLALLVLSMRLPWDAGLSAMLGMETINASLWAGLVATLVVSAVFVRFLRDIPVRDYLETQDCIPARTLPSTSAGAVLALALLLSVYNVAYRDQWNIGHQILSKHVSSELNYHVMSFQTRSKDKEVTFVAAVGAYDDYGYCIGRFFWTGKETGEGSYRLQSTGFQPVSGSCEALLGTG